MPDRLRRRHRIVLCAMTMLAGVFLAPATSLARTPEEPSQASLVGSYLAGRFARSQNETGEAASFYREALERDPGNEVLLEQSFLMEAAEGDWPRAVRLAEELTVKQTNHRMARVFLGLSAFKAGRFAEADENMAAASSGPIGELTSALSRAWIKLGSGDVQGSLDLLEVPKQADWAQEYLRFHRALIADVAGRRAEARAAFERVFRQDSRTLRTALAYAHHAAAGGDVKLAKSILKDHVDRTQAEAHPLVRALEAQLDGKSKVALLVPGAADGLAEVFYGLGEALTGEGGVSIGVLYLQMALFVKPDHPFALVALAQAYETTKRFENANTVYERVPRMTALETNIEIQRAFNLSSLERVDEAKALLDKATSRDGKDIRLFDALGSIMRGQKRYAEAVGYYSRAIALVSKPEKRHWAYYYARGTCYERLKNWPDAEADLQRALKLYPDQPLVLNYLGYSWIDQNRNLKQGMALIEKAVSLKPEDGYIVDSLGWAHYKLGNYKDAVRHLERAVELRPEDPVLNDHLGDALWRVGREREARFQWDQALILKPEPEEVEKIKKKLAAGLVTRASSRAVTRRTKEANAKTGGPALQSSGNPKAVTTRPLVE